MLQLIIYSYAYSMAFGREPKALKVINFVKTRTPKMNVLDAATMKQEDGRIGLTEPNHQYEKISA